MILSKWLRLTFNGDFISGWTVSPPWFWLDWEIKVCGEEVMHAFIQGKSSFQYCWPWPMWGLELCFSAFLLFNLLEGEGWGRGTRLETLTRYWNLKFLVGGGDEYSTTFQTEFSWQKIGEFAIFYCAIKLRRSPILGRDIYIIYIQFNPTIGPSVQVSLRHYDKVRNRFSCKRAKKTGVSVFTPHVHYVSEEYAFWVLVLSPRGTCSQVHFLGSCV